MLPQWRYDQARQDAALHVQVAVRHVQSGVPTPADVRVDAEVIRVFRGEPTVTVGDPVHFTVSVLSGEEDLDRVPVGGTRWTNYAALQTARYLEVFLDGTPPDCRIRLWQQEILAEPTERPAMPVRHLMRNPPLSWLTALWRLLTGQA